MNRQFLAAAIFAALFAALFAVAPSRADQNAPQLDDLFAQLKTGLNAAAAVEVTRAIWDAWLQHDERGVNQQMDAGLRAMRDRLWRDALVCFDAAVALAPDFAEAWNKRATVYYMLGDFEASSADVAETLRLEPRHFGALVGQGMMHMQSREDALALVYFRRALAVNPHMDNVRGYVERLARGEKPI